MHRHAHIRTDKDTKQMDFRTFFSRAKICVGQQMIILLTVHFLKKSLTLVPFRPTIGAVSTSPLPAEPNLFEVVVWSSSDFFKEFSILNHTNRAEGIC
ncbi:hypothetical protein BCR42DRAFT_417690 [Absidia repens]|uniref:Cytochrome P450 n=1 Tax=Absidia repens TaxID=90262 RepID=A0A1X2IE71_9FUNG|nr:hypothetical protein BCR42DRAFT_417690 [Absidia repens]